MTTCNCILPEKCRINIKFIVKLKKLAAKTFQILTEAYGNEPLSSEPEFEWYKRFSGGTVNVEDDELDGCSRNEKVSNHDSIPITIDCNVVAFIVFEEGFHQPIKRTKQLVFLDVTVFRHTLTPNAAVLFVDVAIQPEVRFIAKQNSLTKIAIIIFEIKLHNLKALFRRESIHDELPNQTENSPDSC
ncbi:hypothetical protein TNCV_4538481 [Trichonephila clavipes]|uniref:Mos1 transposase HTH domain-containing protein n=1 Tax=Trichonephila clavipes TaxID=2585209 RepID=A0A8X6WEV5_TRICX|nr:hypothetical protein TNCV_4538481 [Trichonephila clavipes]